MYEPLRIAVATEGPTDAIVLRAIMHSLLLDLEFEFQTLQPEGSVAFGSGPFSKTGVGWVGVYRWCRQSVNEGEGSVSGSSALSNHNVVIVHVDADVAGRRYSSGNIHDAPRDDLPCEERCPPPENTTNALRAVVLNWLGENECPPQVVLFTPSKSTEAWVVAAIWPENHVVQRDNWECHPNPEGQLRAMPQKTRIEKRPDDYRLKQRKIANSWPQLVARLTEARRFEQEFLAAIPVEIHDC